jgi:hypothetical protein
LPPSTASRRSPSLVALGAAALASYAVVGADSRWLVALGATFAHSLPFATAPTSGWHDVPALAQAVFAGLYSVLGERGLVLAQVVASFVSFAVLARGTRSGVASLIVLVGALPLVAVVRAELFSLALLPVLLYLLECAPERLWLAPPLLALWANLHGSVLVGLGLLVVYVAVAARRQWPVAVVGTLALCVTPALWHTPEYFLGVARNESARRGIGLWAPLGLRPFDVVLAVCALALAFLGRKHFRAWEAVAAVGLAAATVHSARIGPWLLFVLAYPAGRALRARRPRARRAVAVALVTLVVVGVALGPADAGERTLARRAARTHEPVLAEPTLAEQVEVAGGRVWVADPIDAFRRSDQALYLDWLEGHGRRAVDHARYVLVADRSDAGRAARTDARLAQVERRRGYVLYRVSVAGTESAPKPRR